MFHKRRKEKKKISHCILRISSGGRSCLARTGPGKIRTPLGLLKLTLLSKIHDRKKGLERRGSKIGDQHQSSSKQVLQNREVHL